MPRSKAGLSRKAAYGRVPLLFLVLALAVVPWSTPALADAGQLSLIHISEPTRPERIGGGRGVG